MPTLISNTSPVLYLGRIGQLNLLPQLFEGIYVPEQVCMELDKGRLLRADTVDPRGLSWVTVVTVAPALINGLPNNDLGLGELSAIAYGSQQTTALLALDDYQARVLADQLGLKLIGTVGILLRAKRLGLQPTIRPLLDKLQQEGFYLSQSLYTHVLQRANEL